MNTTVRPVCDERADHLEQLAGFLGRREHGGRLVEDQDLRAPGEHAQDLDALLLAHRQLPDLGRRWRRAARTRPSAPPCASRGPAPDVAAAWPSQPRWMFSATVIGATSLKCWCTMPMPAAMASAGEWNCRSTPSTSMRAGVGPVDAGQHVGQRRLAGAVLAEQHVDLAAAQLEVDVRRGPARRRSSSRRCGRRPPARRTAWRRLPSLSPRRRTHPRRPSRRGTPAGRPASRPPPAARCPGCRRSARCTGSATRRAAAAAARRRRR